MNDDDPVHLYQRFTESFNKIARTGGEAGPGGAEGLAGTPGVYQNLDLDMQYAHQSQVRLRDNILLKRRFLTCNC